MDLPPQNLSEHGPLAISRYARRMVALWISWIAEGRAAIRIPSPQQPGPSVPRMHFHPYPELFLQISGPPRQEMSGQPMVLRPSDLCVMPRTVQHREWAANTPASRCGVCCWRIWPGCTRAMGKLLDQHSGQRMRY